jgi:ABC-type sugar transport system permease subunit
MVYPIIFSLKASFTTWNGVQSMEWVGLDNYVKLVHDKIFLQALLNGVIMFFMYVPFMLLMALFLAVLLNRPRQKFKNFFRTSFFIPNITCIVAISYVFLLMFDTKFGLINKVLTNLSIPAVRWFGSAFGARLVIGIMVTWKYMGYNMILMMAGLQTIPGSLVEAAKIDGASSFRVFTRITIPLMRPVLLFTTILSTMGTFSLFTEPLILTNGGGPLNKTMSCVLYIYMESFQHLRMGYASALAYAFFFIMLAFTFLQFQLNKKLEKR